MKAAGIIAEYNPFHNGHLYQLEQAKNIYGCTHFVSLMSGDFLQRGIPAISDKYHRAKMAVISGVDVIIELPFVYATANAGDFAMAAVTLFNNLNSVDCLVFGAECDDLGLLSEIADIVTTEPDNYSELIKYYTSNGFSYPAARQKAIISCCTKAADIISEPNNILAIEYLSALKKTGSSIKPLLIKRHSSGYNSSDFSGNICSASAIRNLLQTTDLTANDKNNIFKNVLPESVYPEFVNNINKFFPIYENDLTPFIQHQMIMNVENMYEVSDMTEELSNKLKKISISNSYNDICNLLKTKEITMSHINRALIHYILNFSTKDANEFKDTGLIYYAHILSLKKSSSDILKKIKNNTKIPVFTKTADAYKMLSDIGNKQLEYDIKATKLYNSAVYNKFHYSLPDDYTVKIPII